MTKLDARNYRWTPWSRCAGPFDFLKKTTLPVAIEDVIFDEETFDKTEFMKNGVSLSFYGSGDIHDYAAVLCEDGTIFFCIIEGTRFTDTFHSADDITMKYYTLAKL